MRLLVLGGTKFVGRAIVEAALARDHELTLFNRGQTNPGLFPDVEQIRGDRTESLDALAGREWDAVVDVATFIPRVVRLSVDALRGRVERYVYVSSVSVYGDLSVAPLEGNRVAELEDPNSESLEDYGALKAACERIVEAAYAGRALIVRPGLIVGPHDPTDRFTYWPRRVAEGGRVLAPAPPDAPVQFIDVRDLAEWIVHATESESSGVYNATGEPSTFERLLETCSRVAGSNAEIVWVPSDRLVEAGVGEWMELPLWIAAPEFAAMQRASVAKAVDAGLTFRPLEETVRATLEWDRARETPRAEGVGLAPERERELLASA
ncbi:MAG: NAD-dependent epimerase/dehydratase family protein [Actinobacteria bacterium]|nr:MAG: NAD-dependent epimerase/dehydratase family protein [Actinomycetota bacterium]